MKPFYRKILPSSDNSFSINEFKLPYFDVPWHLHPQYELIYVIESAGKRYVGDSIENFEGGDLVLLGSFLPHCWLNDEIANCSGKNFGTHYIVIHFDIEFLGKDFFFKPELAGVNQLLQLAKQGILFTGREAETVKSKIKVLSGLEPIDRLIEMLQIFKLLMNAENKKLLSTLGFLNGVPKNEDVTINKVQQFILENFKHEIHLKDFAQHIGMTETSFCRYFKRIMKKSLFTYIKEFRIGYACRLLKETDLSIAQVCYECGYDNQSNFYRQFKSMKKSTPQEYRLNSG